MGSVVKGAIAIKDNMSATLRSIRKEQSAFRQDVEQTRKSLVNTWAKKYEARLEATAATKKINALRQKVEPLRKKVVTAVAIKDIAASKIKAVSNKVKAVGKMVSTPVVRLKDQVSSGISKVKGKLKSLAKSVVIPVTVAATVAAAALGGAVSSGMQLEQQQVSIKHFIGATNEGMDEAGIQKVADEFTTALRNNANRTPFETGEVIAAGSRAVAVANGDTKEAMRLVQLAEDMAAASGGTQSIGDAIEALADAKLGEMERLKSFGFKVSAEEFQTKGFEGVSSDLQGFFGGAAEKLASTGAGLISTIKGKLKSNVADFGLKAVEKLKPALESVIGLIDKVSPVIEKFGQGFAEKIGVGIEAVSAAVPRLISVFSEVKPVLQGFRDGFKPMLPQLQQFGSTVGTTIQQVIASALPAIGSIIQTVQSVLPAVLPVLQTVVTAVGGIISQAAPVIAGLVQGIGTVISTLAPMFQTIFDGIGQKVGTVIDFISGKMGFIQEVISTAAPLISDILSTVWSVVSPILDALINIFKIVFNVVQKVWPGIQKIMESVWKIIKPIVEGVGTVVGKIAGAFGWIADKLGGGEEAGANAQGTNNWRGGVTWVGEKGPELVDLPRGSRVLPHKESVQLTARQITRRTDLLPLPAPVKRGNSVERLLHSVTVTIAKLADQIIVREEADIEKIGAAVAKEVVFAARNMVPA